MDFLPLVDLMLTFVTTTSAISIRNCPGSLVIRLKSLLLYREKMSGQLNINSYLLPYIVASVLT
jgi:hypothetical protein